MLARSFFGIRKDSAENGVVAFGAEAIIEMHQDVIIQLQTDTLIHKALQLGTCA